MFWHQTSYLWKPGRAALGAARQTSHCSARLLTEVLCAKKHTEGFAMTQGAKVAYYKWIMRPNAMFWVWTKKGSIHNPLWLGHSGFYFPCTLNGAKQSGRNAIQKRRETAAFYLRETATNSDPETAPRLLRALPWQTDGAAPLSPDPAICGQLKAPMEAQQSQAAAKGSPGKSCR